MTAGTGCAGFTAVTAMQSEFTKEELAAQASTLEGLAERFDLTSEE